jgi:hypothetical protein
MRYFASLTWETRLLSRLSKLFTLVFLLISRVVTVQSIRFSQCSLLQKHSVAGGIGVFAGKNFSRGQVIERFLSLDVPSKVVKGSILDKYVFSSGVEGVDSLILGYAMIYNHMQSNESTVMLIGSRRHITSQRANRETEDFAVFAKRDIVQGEEIFSNYGDGNSWFRQRNLVEVPLSAVAKASSYQLFAKALPGCPVGNVETFAGRLYAAQMIMKGEIIEVARALLLPELFKANSTLRKYSWYSETDDTAMLLLGNGALYRAADNGDMQSVNLLYGWYNEAPSDGTNTTAVALFWDDLVRDEMAFVTIFARRNILCGEEVLVGLVVDANTGIRRVFNQMLPARNNIPPIDAGSR